MGTDTLDNRERERAEALIEEGSAKIHQGVQILSAKEANIGAKVEIVINYYNTGMNSGQCRCSRP